MPALQLLQIVQCDILEVYTQLLNKIKKIARDNMEIDRDDLKGEIGDILWYLAQISTELGIDFEDVALHNLEKLKSRHERGKIAGSGDNR